MTYVDFINKYGNENYDIFAYAYFKALQEVVSEKNLEKYIQEASEDKKSIETAAEIIKNINSKTNRNYNYYDFNQLMTTTPTTIPVSSQPYITYDNSLPTTWDSSKIKF